jgi:kynurenine formamidase
MTLTPKNVCYTKTNYTNWYEPLYTRSCKSVKPEEVLNMASIHELAQLWKQFECIDLTARLENFMPRWPTHPVTIIHPSITHETDGYFCQTLFLSEHTGTHVDAPAHSIPQLSEHTIDKVAVDHLSALAKVLDFSDRSLKPGDLLSGDDLEQKVASLGIQINKGDIVLLNFGWMDKYWQVGQNWTWYGSNSPGLEESACAYLASKDIRAVGCDTVACDIAVVDGKASAGPGHLKYFLPNNILIIECLTNLSKLKSECFFITLPLKIKGGSGSPVRAMALQ